MRVLPAVLQGRAVAQVPQEDGAQRHNNERWYRADGCQGREFV